MTDDRIKVTDKRIFTADGQLRDEFRHLEGGESPPETVETPSPAASESAEGADRPEPEPSTETPRLEIPATGQALDKPGFLDLVHLLAQSAIVYLGDTQMPDGESVQDLELARMHIDLLDVLREKTLGNLNSQETAVVEDLLYQLRMRYVQKRG